MPTVCRAKAARLGITEYGSSEEVSSTDLFLIISAIVQMLEKLRAIPAEKFGIMNMNREKEPDVDLGKIASVTSFSV